MAQVLRDFYEVLGVERDAPEEAIKRAYRALARKLHPDVSDEPGAEVRFNELAEAYEVLSNPRARLLYDRLGYRGWRRGFVSAFRRRPDDGSTELVAEIDLDWFHAERGGDVPLRYSTSTVCIRCAGSGNEPGSAPVDCEGCGGSGNVRSHEEHDGFEMLRLEPCRDCDGRGRLPGRRCRDCDGSGRRRREQELLVLVPPGVRSGDRLRVEGVDGQVLVRVRPRPVDSPFVRGLALLALLAAIALLVYLFV